MAIQNLSKVSSLTAADVFALYSSAVGNDAGVTLATLLAWMEENLLISAGTVDSTGITDSTAIGRSILTAANAAAVLALIGGGTVDAAGVLAAMQAMDGSQETAARAAIQAVDAAGARAAVILAPVTLSANTSLTRSSHGNRTLYVDTAGLTLTINNDATGGWQSDDFIQIKAIGSGSATLLQGTATLTTGTGAAVATASAVGRQVQAQWISANNWETISVAQSGAAYTNEDAQDAAASMIAAGTHTGISFSYNDAGNALSATVSGGGGAVATDVIWDAAGDLAVGTGADTAAKLTKGSATQALAVNNAGTTLAYRWAPQIIAPDSLTTLAAGGATPATCAVFTIPAGALGVSGVLNIRGLVKRNGAGGTTPTLTAYLSASTFDNTTTLVNLSTGLTMGSANGYWMFDWHAISGNGTDQASVLRLLNNFGDSVGGPAISAGLAPGAVSTTLNTAANWTITLRGTTGAADGLQLIWAFIEIRRYA